jgi:crossover junction endodeoxyribonuclease RuvC
MLVIGIDPGTANTGFGLIRQTPDGRLIMVDFGVIKTPSNEPMPNRLSQLHRDLSDLLGFHKPDSGAVEKLFFQRNVKTAISVGQARGVAILALAQAGVEIEEYTPGEVKQAVVGYGGAEKAQVQAMVGALLEMETVPRPDDAADALAVAICHLHSCLLRKRLEGAL